MAPKFQPACKKPFDREGVAKIPDIWVRRLVALTKFVSSIVLLIITLRETIP